MNVPCKLQQKHRLLVIVRGYLQRACCAVLLLLLSHTVKAEPLDEAVAEDHVLSVIAQALAAYDIDVTTNLNARDIGRRPQNPRLGRFPDIPEGMLPATYELLAWEDEFRSAQVGGLALLVGEFDSITTDIWITAPSESRVFITYQAEDLGAAEKIQQVASAYNMPAKLLAPDSDIAEAGEFYATAAQRLALDSTGARRYDSNITELRYLGERVRRNSNSLFSSIEDIGDADLARNEPAVFLKESLGDEFNQSTIREIIVPGGVALGESARLPLEPSALVFADNQLTLRDADGNSWQLPALDIKTIKALFDFVQRSQLIRSDAMVDIDERGRVRIASALRDTDAGFHITEADTKPFEFVDNLDVTKSVIIDTAVVWEPLQSGRLLTFDTDFEVRFLSADNMRIAQTRAALEYTFSAASGTVDYEDSWGREARRLRDDLDYEGLGSSVALVAEYAGWIGLFRALDEAEVPFLQGRYTFMKLDKSGRETPARI